MLSYTSLGFVFYDGGLVWALIDFADLGFVDLFDLIALTQYVFLCFGFSQMFTVSFVGLLILGIVGFKL